MTDPMFEVIDRFCCGLSDAVVVAETAFAVCGLDTKIGVLLQAQKMAKVGAL